MVRPAMFQRILKSLQVGQPTVDAFAQQGESLVPRFWGRGGECEDAFNTDWSAEPLVYANPPVLPAG